MALTLTTTPRWAGQNIRVELVDELPDHPDDGF
jgi:hypothetical protein